MEKAQIHFETIYTSNYAKVTRICLGYVNGNVAIAEELTQEVFIKVWENLASFRQDGTIATWIYRITVNTCLLYFRKKKKGNMTGITKEVPQIEEEGNESKEGQLEKMYYCINKLPQEHKAIILLELEGLPQKEIADIMGLSHEAIRVRIHRIKNSLTKCVQHGSI
jgi:RNA polymerase sigma-70 factor (ECF subfamily)